MYAFEFTINVNAHKNIRKCNNKYNSSDAMFGRWSLNLFSGSLMFVVAAAQMSWEAITDSIVHKNSHSSHAIAQRIELSIERTWKESRTAIIDLKEKLNEIIAALEASMTFLRNKWKPTLRKLCARTERTRNINTLFASSQSNNGKMSNYGIRTWLCTTNTVDACKPFRTDKHK